ncbi:TonB-dependent receptor plug domain-containing protein [Telluria aromaticivorans]|uniref:TonB-dependent receptor n=1 Tax=Telluria aromaticivorans TaxID=2725995 RepID=A0A7Y2JYW0_9BURK|nr:TonB-dependent receptor [Telluria aromaticivorans]NNG23566.1 TonB-dependent receptor [Telluria aromaticivorans]
MRTIRTGSACALLLAAHACASAQSTPQPMQQVVIKAGAGDGRAQSTTTSIVVGRDELLRLGDSSLSEVLKRQPGITVDTTAGKAPEVRMRGMGGGYVAILLNGLPAPSGFSLESISPDLVERIEIQRAATAETSAQGMAGTINVILRRAGPAKGATANEVKAGSALTAGRLAPQLVAQHSGRTGTLAYSVSATLRRHVNPIAALTLEEGADPALLRRTAWTDHQVEDLLELAPRLSWQPTALDVITSHSYLRKRHIDNAKREDETTDTGAPTAFPHADHRYETRPLNAYADLAWTRRLDTGARLAMKLSGFYTTRDAAFEYRGLDLQDTLLATHYVASGPVEREWTFSGSWRRPLWGSHALAAGWEFGRKARSEYRRERRLDAAGALLLLSDEAYRATVARSAFFIQDEWDIADGWSAYAGLRREDLATRGEGNADAPVDVDAGAWSPVFQTLYKPQQAGDTGPRDGFRLAVSRTYKAPNIIQLMPRRYAVDNNNSATNPDQQGNPTLRPELALGIDLAWERFFGKSDMLSVSAFHKRIRDITLTRIDQRDGLWTAMPVNGGDATVSGIEFEGKATRGALSARINLARNWSRVDEVPGPGNRIEGQAAWSGNLGLDYAAPTTGVDLGGSYTYRGRVAQRSSALLFSDNGARRQLDLYALWKRSSDARLRMSVSNLLQRDHSERLLYAGERALARTTVYRVRPVWRLMWEQAL